MRGVRRRFAESSDTPTPPRQKESTRTCVDHTLLAGTLKRIKMNTSRSMLGGIIIAEGAFHNLHFLIVCNARRDYKTPVDANNRGFPLVAPLQRQPT